jgi:hypothetical protein
MRRNKGLTLLALVALAAFTITATIGGSATASGGNAVAAKKKCKKKKASSAKKKKKCKKKKGGGTTNTPLVRATVTWSNGGSSDVDVDLFVFGDNGQQAGNGSDSIPLSTLSPDVTGPAGSETFTDLAFNQHRSFSYGVCYMVSGSVHTDITITYVTADGVSHTDTHAGPDDPNPSPGSSIHYSYPNGPPIPTFCGTTSQGN